MALRQFTVILRGWHLIIVMISREIKESVTQRRDGTRQLDHKLKMCEAS